MIVCNAGVYFDKAERLETGFAPALWQDTFATNVTGVFLTVQHGLPRLAPGGKIAILSSQMASTERAPGAATSTAPSKAAVLNLGRNLATDLRSQGIAVGVYDPGWPRPIWAAAALRLRRRPLRLGCCNASNS